MNLKEEVQPLLDQYMRFNGRGNVVSANLTLAEIIKKLVAAIDDNQAVMTQLSPEGIEDPTMMVNVAQLMAQVEESFGGIDALTDAVMMVEDKPKRGRPKKIRD